MNPTRLLRVAATATYNAPARRVLVLHRRGSPTVDYYLLPRLAEQIDLPMDRHAYSHPFEPRRAGAIDPEGLFVIVCRYLSLPWWFYLWRRRRQLAGVVYFIDDDVPAGLADPSQTIGYKLYLLLHGLLPTPFLSRITSAIWVSTPPLAHLHRRSAPRVLPPRLPPGEVRPDRYVTVFYHGETHRREVRFLRPIIRAVQQRCPHVIFEVFGDRSIRRMFADVPRVVTIHHMSWSDFQSYAHFRPGDIGLAPLLPSRFNASRSGTKFLQITLSGGVGIFSDVPQFRAMVRDGADGLLLDNDPNLWIEAIVNLVNDPDRREAMRASAWQRAHDLSNGREDPLIPPGGPEGGRQP